MADRFSNLSLRSTGSTVIFTPNFGGGVFYFVRSLFVRCTAASNVSIPASISVGTNAPNYDNIISITPLTGVLTAGTALRIGANLQIPVFRNAPILINVTTAATGGSQTVDIFLDGFYGV